MNFKVMQAKCEEVAGVMKAIAHPQRLMLMCHLSQGEKSVSELLALCDVSQSQLSQFLNRLQREKLLRVRREGSFSYYRIADKNMTKLIQSMQKIFCQD